MLYPATPKGAYSQFPNWMLGDLFSPQILLEQEDEQEIREILTQSYDPGHSDPHWTAYVALNQASKGGFL